MMIKKYVSTPSRICLFGEHQDYLGLEVIALAIDLRFSASVEKRQDGKIDIKIRNSAIGTLGQENIQGLYEHYQIDLKKPIFYENNRDYLKSSVQVLLKQGYDLGSGFSIVMDSTIPIGKGMCSSSTMIVALIKALLEGIESPDRENAEKIARLAFLAEIVEFQEPGGMMDHYTSALGGQVHLNFADGKTKVTKLSGSIPECFILFDSLEVKNTTQVLADSKIPTLEALEMLKPYGVERVTDFIDRPELMESIDQLDEYRKKKLMVNIDNYRILQEALVLLKSGNYQPQQLGKLIYRHHLNLRDGLGISTPAIEKILDTALAHGALGGKVNGSGGGGCLFVYAMEQDAERIIQAVSAMGYPGRRIYQDTGVRLDRIERMD